MVGYRKIFFFQYHEASYTGHIFQIQLSILCLILILSPGLVNDLATIRVKKEKGECRYELIDNENDGTVEWQSILNRKDWDDEKCE